MIYKHSGKWIWQREYISRTLELREMLLSFQTGFKLASAAVVCDTRAYFRLGTFTSYNWTQVLEACDSLKLLSIYFHLCVDATGVVCHQLGLLSTDLYAIDCGGFVEMFTNFASSSSSPAKPSMSPAHSALDLQPAIWICMPVELSVQFSSLIIWVIIGTWQMIIHPIAHWTLISTERLQPATLETKDRGGVGRKNGPCPSQNSIR